MQGRQAGGSDEADLWTVQSCLAAPQTFSLHGKSDLVLGRQPNGFTIRGYIDLILRRTCACVR